jgi:hypothetical protein
MSTTPAAHRLRVGTSTGLAARTCDRDGPRIEQVYVDVSTVADEHHPVIISGWVGYNVPATMMLTRRQAADLAGLLAKALAP